MFRFPLLVLALALTSVAARAVSPATGAPMDEHEAFERVRTARAFVITKGDPAAPLTLQERAFFEVLQGPQPATKFGLLVTKGTLAGRMYALVGLKTTAPEIFAKKLPAFLKSWRRVPVAVGAGKTKNVSCHTVAAEIRDTDYSGYLKK